MKNSTLLATGLVGMIVTALCCFTPALVVLLGVIGLSAWAAWIDNILLPVLAVFLGVTAYGLWRRQRAAVCCGDKHQGGRSDR